MVLKPVSEHNTHLFKTHQTEKSQHLIISCANMKITVHAILLTELEFSDLIRQEDGKQQAGTVHHLLS